MEKRLFLLLILLASFLRGVVAFAGVEQLSEQEFRDLSREIAPKVNLFRDVWAADPQAEFYGGTSRDYLYWLKGQFREAHSKADAEKIRGALKKRASIDVREFIIGESDVDIISSNGVTVDPARYGVRKIDSHGASYFDPGSETWTNELNQGYIPAEKIRLGANGTIPVPELGDGVKEIYNGKLTIHFADPKIFAKTKYAKEKLNHPVLLALRYLRLQAMNYYQSHGDGLPDKSLLFDGMDDVSRAAVKKVIDDSLLHQTLKPYLAQSRFKSWINGTLQKSFLSYTNQTAALQILNAFGVDRLPEIYPEVEAVNQYVFQQYRDENAIAANLQKFHVDKDKFYQATSAFFPDGQLYHGTKTEEGFRSILFQGALNSTKGSAGEGLYGVPETHKEFSERWGGDKERLLRFPVNNNARIVDIKTGEGKRIFAKFGGDFETFSRAFGVDILRYPYNETDAYVVKNSTVLGRAQGVYRELLHFDKLLERLKKSHSLEERIGLVKLNSLNDQNVELLHQEFPDLSADVFRWMTEHPAAASAADKRALLALAKKEIMRELSKNDPALVHKIMEALSPLSVDSAKLLLEAPDSLGNEITAAIEKDFARALAPSVRVSETHGDFEALFNHPKSARLGPMLEKYLLQGEHARRHGFVKMFALPHMAALENVMLKVMDVDEPNVRDQLAQYIFTQPGAVNFPHAFERWLSSRRDGNHEYYLKQLLAAPHLHTNDALLERVTRLISPNYPDLLGELFSKLPAEIREKLLPLAQQLVVADRQYDLIKGAFPEGSRPSPAEKKVIWNAWIKSRPNRQYEFTSLIAPQIAELPAAERLAYYRRLVSEKHVNAAWNAAEYFFGRPPTERSAELWSVLQSQVHYPEIAVALGRFGNFTPQSRERELLEAGLNAQDKSSRYLFEKNLTGLALPRDQALLLKFLDPLPGEPVPAKIIGEHLMRHDAAASEEVALAILRNKRDFDISAFTPLLAMEHTKGWTRTQLLYIEKKYGWKPNAIQLANIETPEGKIKLKAVFLEDKYKWQAKLYLDRQFPANGQPVKGLRGFMMDCAAGFAKLK